MSEIKKTIEESISERVKIILDDDTVATLVKAEVARMCVLEDPSRGYHGSYTQGEKTSEIRRLVHAEVIKLVHARVKDLLADRDTQQQILEATTEGFVKMGGALFENIIGNLMNPIMSKLRSDVGHY